LSSCCGASRFWFNQGLALVKERLDRRAAGEDVDVPWSYKSLCGAFRGDAVKNQLAPWRGEVVTGSYQAGLEALGSALRKFSEGKRAGRPVGFPRFRARGRCHASVIFQRPRLLDARHVCLDNRRLGPVKSKESLRKLVGLLERDPHARVLRSTVQRTCGGWVISFTVERSPKARRARRPDAAVGVDVGLARLATFSTGQAAPNSRPLRAVLGRLRRLQRQLDRQRRAANPGNYVPDGRVKPGPKTWAMSARMVRTEERVRRLHERVANLRREQAHQLTSDADARVRRHRRRDARGQEHDGQPPARPADQRRRLGHHSQPARVQDLVVGWQPARCRRPLPSLLEDVLCVRSSESQAEPGRARLHLRRHRLRARAGPRPQRGPEPRPHGAASRAGRGLAVPRRRHRSGDTKRAQRAGQTRPGRAQPREARRPPGSSQRGNAPALAA